LERHLLLWFETQVTGGANVVMYTRGNDVDDMSLIFAVLVSCVVFALCGDEYQIYAIKKRSTSSYGDAFFIFYFVFLLFGSSEASGTSRSNGTRLALHVEFYSVLLTADGLHLDRAMLL
jgi:hypothetical protein